MRITLKELEILLEEEIEDNDKPNVAEKKIKKVFIVHGRDDSKKYELSRFLYEQGLDQLFYMNKLIMFKQLLKK